MTVLVVVVQNSMAGDSNRCFNNLCGSHHQGFFLNGAEVVEMTVSVKNQPHSGLESPTRPLSTYFWQDSVEAFGFKQIKFKSYPIVNFNIKLFIRRTT